MSPFKIGLCIGVILGGNAMLVAIALVFGIPQQQQPAAPVESSDPWPR